MPQFSIIRTILPQLQKAKDIKLLVRLTSYEVSTKSVDISALDIINKIGQVKCLNTLHAKSILTDTQAYIGSFNFTHSAFFRNYELGIIFDEKLTLKEVESYFIRSWEQAISFEEARQKIEVDRVLLETVGWQKVKEWWDTISSLNLIDYNPSVNTVVFLPMPKPPLDRSNMMIQPILDFCNSIDNVEVVLFSELYGSIPLRFAEQFGEQGEYFFDEPANKFYSKNELLPDGQTAARVTAKFMKQNRGNQFIAPLPNNFKRLSFLKATEQYTDLTIKLPNVQSPIIGYLRGANGAVSFLRSQI